MSALPENKDMTTSDEIKRCLKQLTDSNFVIRLNAEKRLKSLGTEAIPVLMEEFDKEFQRYARRQAKFLKYVMSLCAASTTLVTVAFIAFLLSGQSSTFHTIVQIVLMAFLPFSIFLKFFSEVPIRLKAIFSVLLEMRDPRVFSTILEIYSVCGVSAFDYTLELLTLYLPQTTSDQWEKLGSKQRKILYDLVQCRGKLKAKRNDEFTLAALKSLEQYGDANAIPAVQNIAFLGSNEELRTAARECLPYLETRRDEQSTRQTLLRASQSGSGKDHLLRVPTYVPNTESEQLLRMP